MAPPDPETSVGVKHLSWWADYSTTGGDDDDLCFIWTTLIRRPLLITAVKDDIIVMNVNTHDRAARSELPISSL